MAVTGRHCGDRRARPPHRLGLWLPDAAEARARLDDVVVDQPQGLHKYIEFVINNCVVDSTALAVLVAVWYVVRRDDRPRRLVALAALPLIGVAGQAVLGGITVLTHCCRPPWRRTSSSRR